MIVQGRGHRRQVMPFTGERGGMTDPEVRVKGPKLYFLPMTAKTR